ncbi:MAG: phage tail tube protein [Candidatus Bathyarchaeia archaeon]
MVYGGHEAKFYYVVESVYGQIPTSPQMLGIENVESVEPMIDPGNIKLRGIGTRDLTAIKRGLRQVGVKVDYAVPSDDVMQFLQHTLTLYPLTIEVIYDKSGTIVDLRFTGCRVDKTTVQCSVEEVVKASVELIGQSLAAETSKISGASYTDFGGAIPFSQCYVQFGTASGGNLQTIEEITDWKFTVANNLKRVPVIRSTSGELLKFLQPRHRSITGELTFEFENRTRYYEVINDTEFSVKLGLGPKYVLLKYCKWDSVKTPTRLEDLVSLKGEFTARTVEFEGVS